MNMTFSTYRKNCRQACGTTGACHTNMQSARFLPLCLFALLPFLSACTEYDDEMPNEEELALMRNGGKTAQLALSLGSANLQTRMGDDAVQADDNDLTKFRGIESLHLIPFVSNASGADPVTAALEKRGTELIELRSIAAGTAQLNNQANNYNTYRQKVSMPYGVNAFLCYGKAPSSDPKVYGAITENNIMAKKPADISFSLQPITTVETVKASDSKATNLITFLNGIYTAGDWTNNVILSSVKDDFFSASNTAGSSANVLAMTLNLYDALKFAESNTAVKPVTDYIKTKINVETRKWSDTGLDGYPANLNLPDGAAYISWNTTSNEFEIATDKSNLSALAVYSVENLVYPPSIYYFANSRIMTHDEKMEGTDEQIETELQNIFQNTDRTQWGTESNWTCGHSAVTPTATIVLDQPKSTGSSDFFFTGARVDAETTVVGIAKSLQYAVSRLDFTISASTSTLQDADGTSIEVTGNAFPVTGILVAGQKDVDWKFEPVTTAGAQEHTIYDSSFTGQYMTTSPQTTPLRTLVLETAKDQTVYVAVELQNNSGQDFVTGNNKRLVPQGCKFYLIGKLTLVTGGSGTNDDPYQYVTGYDANDPANNRAFRQDHVTKADFTVKTLANAYNVIPDFSADQLEFSLGVLDWKMSTPVDLEFGGAVN